MNVQVNRLKTPIFTGDGAVCWIVEIEGYKNAVYHERTPSLDQVIWDTDWIIRQEGK